MRPYVLIYVTDVDRSRAWYERLGFRLRRLHRHGGWAELEWGEFLLYLHGTAAPRPAGFALPGFEAQEGLESLAARLSAAGVLPDPSFSTRASGAC
ncbi:VOC family protein [Deinococcus aluminii]|uniref:VOC domain-containing protein n=1 Tax=Deinococcus aluminii TaxID=1656885 RepID=A0ABP9XBK3_9DEIO